MMRGIRRLAVLTAATGLLAAVAVGINIETAHADTTSCDGQTNATSTTYECDLSETGISDPSVITVTVSDDTAGYTEAVVVNYTVSCTDTTNGTEDSAGAPSEETPVTLDLSLPVSSDGTCDASATVTSPSISSTNATACPTPSAAASPSPSPSPTASTCPDDFSATLGYSANATSSATTASTVKPVTGYDSMCVDDKSNSSANKAKIIVWECNSSDPAQSWNWTDNELRHNGKCINDTGDGGSGTRVILYTCSSAKNDKWKKSNGELKLEAHNGKLCLDDTGYSTTDGTQLIVYTCKDQANEKWTVSS
jgi:Ricin-type beta-trefoil lectin domain